MDESDKQLDLGIGPIEPPAERQHVNDRVWFVNHNGACLVFFCGIILYRFLLTDVVMRRFVAVALRKDKHATQKEIAAAFGHGLRTQIRWEKRYDEMGVKGLEDQKPSGRPQSLDDTKRSILRGWFRSGISNAEMARRIGVSEATIRRELARMDLSRPTTKPLLDGDGPEAEESQSSGEEEEAEPEPEEPWEPEAPAALIPFGTADVDPLNREVDRGLARLGLIDDAVPFFADAPCVPRAGVLVAIPLFVSTGALAVFERIYRSIGPAFYGLRSTVVCLFLMALLRIKRPEHLKEFFPPDLGRVVGLDRMPEVKTLRRKLLRLAAEERGEELMRELARQRVEDDEDRLGYVYVDGHVREYHGKFPLAKGHVASRRYPMPAATDTWVNDANGAPLFVVTSEMNAGLCQMLPAIAEELKGLAGEGKRVTIVFDRGGYSPELFAKLAPHFDLITYRKGEKDPVPLDEFEEKEVVEDGKRKTILVHDKPAVPIGVKRRREGEEPEPWLHMRQVSVIRDDGGMTQVLTTNKAIAATEVLTRMFSRWIQENFFKYAIPEFDLDALPEHGVEPLSEDADRPNPERKKLREQRKQLQNRLDQLLAKLGSELEKNDESRRRTVRGIKIATSSLRKDISETEAQIADITARIEALPARVPASDLVQLKRHRKFVVDSIKMLAYQVESELFRMIEGKYARATDEGRTLLHTIFQSSGQISVHPDELRVTITQLSSAHKTKVLEELCAELNESRALFPGTELRLAFAVEVPEPAIA